MPITSLDLCYKHNLVGYGFCYVHSHNMKLAVKFQIIFIQIYTSYKPPSSKWNSISIQDIENVRVIR